MTIANCAACGTVITVTTRNPNRRYCSPRCRKAAWQARNRRTRKSVGNDVADAVPQRCRRRSGRQRHHRCPHCRHELAVIAVVIPADAAHVQPPEVIT